MLRGHGHGGRGHRRQIDITGANDWLLSARVLRAKRRHNTKQHRKKNRTGTNYQAAHGVTSLRKELSNSGNDWLRLAFEQGMIE